VGPNFRIRKSSTNEQGHGGQQFHVLFALSVEGRFGDFLEKDVCFALNHPIALINDCLSDRLRQMAFPGAGWTQEERAFRTAND
jgi:hypothetical protein